MTYRLAGAAAVTLLLAGCAAGLPGSADEAGEAKVTMAGRWMLAAPNAPMCGIAFTQSANADNGTISPEGGCPGSFYTGRHWAFERGELVVSDQDNEALARLTYSGGIFQGQSINGTPVSLTRPVIPTAR